MAKRTGWNGNEADRDERRHGEPDDPRRDCPWRCMQGDPSCVCQAPSNRTGDTSMQGQE
jgi:hypothetical protein